MRHNARATNGAASAVRGLFLETHCGKRLKLLSQVLFVSMFFFRAVAAESGLTTVTNPQPILDDLQRKMSSVTSVFLEFTQERHYQALSDAPFTSEGVMLIDRPDQIRWETTSPFQSILLGNQKSVAQFEFENGKWKKLDLGLPEMLQRVMQQMALMNQGKLDALTADYNVSVATNSSFTILTLIPKDANVRSLLPSLEIRMLPDLSATKEVVMHENGTDFTRIIFRNEVRGVKFPAGTFDQSKPLDLAAIKAAVNHAP